MMFPRSIPIAQLSCSRVAFRAVLVRIDEIVAHGEGDSLKARVHSEFGQQSLYVTSHGGGRDAQP